MNLGKKFVVISEEEYERLKVKRSDVNTNNTVSKPLNPELQDFQKSATNMKRVWEEDDVPVNEKIRRFTEELTNLKTRYNSLSRRNRESYSPQPNLSTTAMPSKLYNMEENIIQALPKTGKNDGILLLEHLKKHPDIIKWNSNGEIMFKGETLPGSNLKNMVISVITNRKSNVPTLSKGVFVKALSVVFWREI